MCLSLSNTAARMEAIETAGREKKISGKKELAGQIGVSLPYVNRITKGREQLFTKVKRRFFGSL